MKLNAKIKGMVVLGYSLVHYILFGFDVWVALFLVLGIFFVVNGFFKREKTHSSQVKID
jgi:hypothetical protein